MSEELYKAKFRKMQFLYSEYRGFYRNFLNEMEALLENLEAVDKYMDNRFDKEMKEIDEMFKKDKK